jgi:protein SCO1/2|tara:strand:+ start:1271 stop:2104 length:834 start_codon:yes stop_codon:yes gene_type:complete
VAARGRQCISHREHGLKQTLPLLLLAAALVAATPAFGIKARDGDDRFDTSLLRVDEMNHLRDVVPDVEVVTADGPVGLHELIGGKPTILALVYYSCGHTCPATIRGLSKVAIDAPRAEYQVLVLSFDAADTPATMQGAASTLDELPENWVFGLLPEGVNEALTQSVGFNYFFSERDQTFVHPAVLVFLSPEGEVMRYLYGTEPRSEDVELALIESRNREPSLNEIVDMVRLTCFQFDASKSRYVLHPTIIFGGAGIGVLGLVGLAAFVSRKDSKGGP